MFASPAKIAAPARSHLASGRANQSVESTAESAEALAALEARITALVARTPKPLPNPTAEDDALERQRQEFDFITRVQAETEREINALRDMAMEQTKFEDALLKKCIAMIS